MSAERLAVAEFLRRNGMYYETTDVEAVVQSFLQEMRRGLEGQVSCLAMIPTFIDADCPIPRGKKVMVLDAGGTNLRRALVSFGSDGRPVIEHFRKSPMPGTQGPVSRDEFFGTLAAEVRDLTGQADRIGFCFSYPTEILPNRDGRLLHFTKEVKAPEVEGQLIGENLRAALGASGAASDVGVTVLNDTVATLLTGRASHPDRAYGGYVGYILGTGTNCCYLESNAAIGKVAGLETTQSQVINVESGGFSLAPRGSADEALDAKSQVPGSYYFEKATAGGYFGPLVHATLRTAVTQKLFSSAASGALGQLEELTTQAAGDYLHDPAAADNPLAAALTAGTAADRERVFFLIDALLERAARLTAASMAAAVVKSGRGRSPITPICLTVDGTSFYAYYRFQFRVEKYLDAYLGDKGYYYDIVQVKSAPLIGAAIAGLTQ